MKTYYRTASKSSSGVQYRGSREISRVIRDVKAILLSMMNRKTRFEAPSGALSLGRRVFLGIIGGIRVIINDDILQEKV